MSVLGQSNDCLPLGEYNDSVVLAHYQGRGAFCLPLPVVLLLG